MTNDPAHHDDRLFEQVCAKHSVKPEVVSELLKIEREYQLQNKRHGIYDRLRECIQGSVQVEERRD